MSAWPTIALVVALVVSSCSDEARHPTARAAATTTATSLAPLSSQWLAGEWFAHTLALRIDGAGRGTLTWRTYRLCGQDPPPCDTFRDDGILDGGHAIVMSTTLGRAAASGRVISSTDPTGLPVGPVTLRFDRNNDLLYMQPSPRMKEPLCGPNAATVQCS